MSLPSCNQLGQPSTVCGFLTFESQLLNLLEKKNIELFSKFLNVRKFAKWSVTSEIRLWKFENESSISLCSMISDFPKSYFLKRTSLFVARGILLLSTARVFVPQKQN